MSQTQPDIRSFLENVSTLLGCAPVLGDTEVADNMVACRAVETVDSVRYRVRVEGGRVWVSLVSGDRWLSESIEADLMNTGDKLEELIEDELEDLGVRGLPVSFEHFRSDEMLFTFQSPLEIPGGGLPEIERSARDLLLAYVACFGQLGDVGTGEIGVEPE